MQINLNDNVRVKLTPFGIQCMKDYHKWLFAPNVAPPFNPPVPDENGWTTMQMWLVLQEFGPYMHNGMTQIPFEDNVIEIVSKPDVPPPVQVKPEDTVTVLGVNADGSSTVLGTTTTPPAMKRREIAGDMCGTLSEDGSGTPGDFCLWALEQYHEWLESRTGFRLETVVLPAKPQGG